MLGGEAETDPFICEGQRLLGKMSSLHPTPRLPHQLRMGSGIWGEGMVLPYTDSDYALFFFL